MMSCKNRRGQPQEFPLIALSVAVVSSQTRHITHYARLAEIASELKQYIKTLIITAKSCHVGPPDRHLGGEKG